MNINTVSTDLVVLGGGPGGYAAAFYAADMGLAVTLVDVEANPGGVCLYRGCIPSKALLHAAKIIHEARAAKDFGIEFPAPKIDWARLISWKDDVVAKLTKGLGGLAKIRKVNFLQGRGSFLDNETMKVVPTNGQETRLKFKHAIIATGSRPISLPGITLESKRLLDSTRALSLPAIPKKMLIVGAGYIGLELGSVYTAVGTKVTCVEMLPGILPGVDADLAAILHRELSKSFAGFIFNTRVTGITEETGGLRVSFDREPADVFDCVLVCIGRRPNGSGIGLDNTRVEVSDKGFIEVNERRQTAVGHIFAIGDVVGQPMLAHKAAHEARVAVDAILGKNTAFEPLAIPAVIFTDPEVAYSGMMEQEAKENGLDIEVVKFPWAASGRALTLARTEGLTKLIVDKKTELLLGVGLVGPNAGDMISEAALAIEMGATVSDLKLTIHPHPTLSETLMEAAELFFGHCTHMHRPKKK